MGITKHQSLLRQSNDGKRAARCDVARALPLAFARAAEDFIGLPLVVSSVSKESAKQDALSDLLPPSGLYILLEGEAGTTGAAILDATLVCALTEHLTIGSVLDRPPHADRALTAVDAALVAPVFDKLMAQTDQALNETTSAEWSFDHRFGSMVEDLRTLVLSLFGSDFIVHSMELSLGEFKREGRLSLVLPKAHKSVKGQLENALELAAQYQENVMSSHSNINVVLSRFSLPYEVLNSLELGALLEIPPSALKAISLEIQGGVFLAKGQLGQVNGQRAVRVNLPADTCLAEDTPDQKKKKGKKAQTKESIVRDPGGEQDNDRALDSAPNMPETHEGTEVLAELDDLDALVSLPET